MHIEHKVKVEHHFFSKCISGLHTALLNEIA